MATFFKNGDPGCDASNWNESQKPTSFAPTALDTDNWAVSMTALGVQEAVLTAKHGCGFAIWPTQAKLPNGTRYPYRSEVDVLGKFVASMEKAGIGHGFYYSLTNNFFLNVGGHSARGAQGALPGMVPVTQAQFESIAVQQVTELWENFGKLTEIWFDGGYTSDMKAELLTLLERTQPRAVGMNGGGIMGSPVRWAGTEGDMTPGPKSFNSTAGIWSTYCCNNKPGDPCVVMHSSVCALNGPPHGGSGCAATGKAHDAGCNTFYPAGVDYTLQAGDTWFWVPDHPLRPLSEMIQVYHNSVGRNTVMELDFAIDRTGQLEPSHAALYAEFGDWIKKCYGKPVVGGSVLAKSAAIWSVEIDTGTTAVDRIVIQENQTLGQRILRYRVIEVASGVVLTQGESVGNKRIDLLMNTTHSIDPTTCDFPTDLGNDQSVGLTHLPSTAVSNVSACQAACCAAGPSCETYQWCEPDTACRPAGCWVGSAAKTVAGNPGWVSKARGLPVPVSVAGKLRLEVLETALGLEPLLVSFGAFKPCPDGKPPL